LGRYRIVADVPSTPISEDGKLGSCTVLTSASSIRTYTRNFLFGLKIKVTKRLFKYKCESI
jgi:hypothetical protein